MATTIAELKAHLDPAVRHDFIILFDVRDGNPNGDPDAANQPRIDPETMQGLVSDVCLKRKIRNFVDVASGQGERTKIYVQSGEALNSIHERAYTAVGGAKTKAKGKGDAETIRKAQKWLCNNFFDIRLFGAVLSTGNFPAGKVQGPVQLTFARSVDPITPTDHTITRQAVTKEEDLNPQEEGKGKEAEMGSKWTVPYGLYRTTGHYSAHLAERTGVTSEDLDLFWTAVTMMFEDIDRSAARGEMTLHGLYVFSHSSALGDCPAQKLTGRVAVKLKDGIDVPRTFKDYEVSVDEDGLPAGVTLARVVE